MITLKQYAEARGISYEAVRASIKRHSRELEEHISKQGRVTVITDRGAEILDSYRAPRAVKILDAKSENEYIEELKDSIISLQEKIIELEQEKNKGIEAQVRAKMLEDTSKSQQSKIEALEAEIEQHRERVIISAEKMRNAEEKSEKLARDLEEIRKHPIRNLFQRKHYTKMSS